VSSAPWFLNLAHSLGGGGRATREEKQRKLLSKRSLTLSHKLEFNSETGSGRKEKKCSLWEGFLFPLG
jgi:hypothetical protein